MSQHQGHGPHLTRRSWITLALSALGGCGGGAAVTAGAPGTGGTGLYAMGSIQGFGSVILNGIKFDDTLATIHMDGATVLSADLRLGMVANVQAARASSAIPATATTAATLATATASVIEVWSVAQGAIGQVGSGQFTLAGMTVQTNTATVLDGLSNPTQLTAGERVTVWGLQAGADGSTWTATRVAITTDTSVVSSGLVHVTSGQRSLNGLALTGMAVADLAAGTLVRVQGQLSATADSLAVTSVRVLTTSTTEQGEAELEGLVTALVSASRFMLGSVTVDTSGLTQTAPVTLGERVEVAGSWLQGVLQATKLGHENEQTLIEVEIDAPIQAFTSLADFVVRSQRCDASAVTSVGHGSIADLKVGVRIKVKGTKAGDVLIVTEVELETDH